MRLKPGRPDISRYADLFARSPRGTGCAADGDLARGLHAAARRRRVGGADRRILLAPVAGAGGPRPDRTVAATDRRMYRAPRATATGRGTARTQPFRPRTGLRGGGRTHRRHVGGRRVDGERRTRARPARRPDRARRPGRTAAFRRLRRHADRVASLPAGPISGHHHRTRAAAGEGLGLPVRRGMVDADAPPPLRPAVSDPGQRRLRARRVGRPARRSGLPRTRAAWVRSRSGT